MINYIIVTVLIILCALIIRYLYNEKRAGRCIGCAEGHCSGHCAHAKQEQEAVEKLRELKKSINK